jgi:hypothetical protein
MKKRYMIVRIINILAEMKQDDSMVTEDCYKIVDKNYGEPEIAYKVIEEEMREPSHYIVVEYWC